MCGGVEAASAATATQFQAEYSDQLHPICKRKIAVEKVDKRYIAHFSGTDVGPKGIGDKVFLTCEQENIDKYKLREWSFDGEITGDQITVGDGIHEGRWNPYSKESPDPWSGIRWKDGNRWIVIDPTVVTVQAPIEAETAIAEMMTSRAEATVPVSR